MKITNSKKLIVPAIAIAVAVLGGGVYIAHRAEKDSKVAFAYTSGENPTDSTTVQGSTAHDATEVKFKDAKLKAALNKKISAVRSDDQAITIGELKAIAGTVDLSNSGITDLEGVQYLVNATSINVSSNPLQGKVSPLKDLPNLTELNIAKTGTSDLSLIKGTRTTKVKKLNVAQNPAKDLTPLSDMIQLEELSLFNMLVDEKLNLDPIKNLPNLWQINLNTQRVMSQVPTELATLPKLWNLMISGNQIADISGLKQFHHLKNWSTFENMELTLTANNDGLVENPVKDLNGNTVQVAETANIKNADSDGTLSPTGKYLKIVNKKGIGQLETHWSSHISLQNAENSNNISRSFTGKVTIKYDIDQDGPEFDVTTPAKIISRKGEDISPDVNDIFPSDPSGISSFTNDAADKGLDIHNPAPGKYTITYTAIDNRGNKSTISREIEIVNDDPLAALIAKAEKAETTDGRTKATIEALQAQIALAKSTLAEKTAPQSVVDAAVQALQQKIDGLLTDKSSLSEQILAYNQLQENEDYIKNNTELIDIINGANHLASQPNPSVQDVRDMAKKVADKIDELRNEDRKKQSEAISLLREAETEINNPALQPDQLPVVDFEEIEESIAKIQDTKVKAEQQEKLESLKKALADKKDQIDAHKRAEAERKQKEAIAQRRELKTPNTGVARQKEDYTGIIAAGSALSVATGAVVIASKKNRKALRK